MADRSVAQHGKTTHISESRTKTDFELIRLIILRLSGLQPFVKIFLDEVVVGKMRIIADDSVDALGLAF